MLNDRQSILTLELDNEVLEEVTVFGMEEAKKQAVKWEAIYNDCFPGLAPVAFIYIESEMNFKNY